MEQVYQPPQHRILAALNAANPLFPIDLNPNMVEIVNPQLFLGSGGLTNTRATLQAKVTSIPVQHFTGSIYIYYNRLNLQRVLSGCIVPGRNTDYTTSHDIVEVLKSKYKVPIEVSDILPIITGDVEDILITADFTSVGYYSNITLPYEIV